MYLRRERTNRRFVFSSRDKKKNLHCLTKEKKIRRLSLLMCREQGCIVRLSLIQQREMFFYAFRFTDTFPTLFYNIIFTQRALCSSQAVSYECCLVVATKGRKNKTLRHFFCFLLLQRPQRTIAN